VATPGQVIEVPHTGEKFVFVETTEQTGGERLVLDFFVNPGGFSPRPHVHLDVEERVHVRAGRVSLTLSGETTELGPGESAVVPVHVPHGLEAAGDEQAHMTIEVIPAGAFEPLFETVFGLYRDGKSDAHGREPLLAGIPLARATNSYLAGPPIWAQRVFLFIGAPISRLFGYR
jgi:quercetin dioxygenase-like cupin family protein